MEGSDGSGGSGPSPVPSPYLVPFDGSFDVGAAPTAPPSDAPSERALEKKQEELVEQLSDLQRILYAHDKHAVLLVFQALDAAGKDSTIRHVLSGVNPAGCQVYSFKQPSREELDHDFLWRSAIRLPERGRIGIFNRSYYEEVLVVRVHPEYLEAQCLPHRPPLEQLWEERFASIRDHERHLARNGTLVLKFWLNVSRAAQRERFLSRLKEPEKNWKFSEGDLEERRHWDAYQDAYGAALTATSRPWAPWYAVPADDKPFMRWEVTRILVEALRGLGLRYPSVSGEDAERFRRLRERLERE
ncbi:MAG: polyphosphate kinase 2 family protein [Gemmatimonadota bacterium]